MSCIVLFGGSFDPVHNGHVALAAHVGKLFDADEIRILPAGNPWQKAPLAASARDRVNMVKLAFDAAGIAVTVDEREIGRHGATYTIDTLRELRTETGPQTSLVFVIGADQLQQLSSWRDWQQLFGYAHICAASRPGFALDALPTEVATEFRSRAATPAQMRITPCGHTYLEENLALDISATTVRNLLRRGETSAPRTPAKLLAPEVLDYIHQHHLYQS